MEIGQVVELFHAGSWAERLELRAELRHAGRFPEEVEMRDVDGSSG